MAVLLVVLWVRSYWYWDQLYNPITNQHLVIVESASSRVIVLLTSTVPGSPWRWHVSHDLGDKYWGGPLQDWHEQNRESGIFGFAYYVTPWNATYRVPYWFLVLMFATLAAVPWIRWSSRFSLRTLLIGMTVVAVLLGAAMVAFSGS